MDLSFLNATVKKEPLSPRKDKTKQINDSFLNVRVKKEHHSPKKYKAKHSKQIHDVTASPVSVKTNSGKHVGLSKRTSKVDVDIGRPPCTSTLDDSDAFGSNDTVTIKQTNDLRFDKKRLKSLEKPDLLFDRAVVINSDLTDGDDKEVVCIQCPQDFNCQLLEGIEIPLNGTLQIPCTQSSSSLPTIYTVTVTESHSVSKQAVIFTVDGATSQLLPVTKMQRTIIVSKHIEIPFGNRRCFLSPVGVPKLPDNLRQPDIFASISNCNIESVESRAESAGSPATSTAAAVATLQEKYDQFPKLEDIMPSTVLKHYGIVGTGQAESGEGSQQHMKESVHRKLKKKEKVNKHKHHLQELEGTTVKEEPDETNLFEMTGSGGHSGSETSDGERVDTSVTPMQLLGKSRGIEQFDKKVKKKHKKDKRIKQEKAGNNIEIHQGNPVLHPQSTATQLVYATECKDEVDNAKIDTMAHIITTASCDALEHVGAKRKHRESSSSHKLHKKKKKHKHDKYK